jgi:hypothetical protein
MAGLRKDVGLNFLRLHPWRTTVLLAATALLAAPAVATAHHSAPGVDPHLLPVAQNFALVGELEPTTAKGPIIDGQIVDLAVHKGYAYLNSSDEIGCGKGGVYVVDINDPAHPSEAGFIPAQAGYVHTEGAQAVSIATPQFKGDLLAVNDQACGSNRPVGVPADAGGFDLYNVTDPRNPQILVQNAGDRSPESSLVPTPGAFANHSRSVHVWQDGNRAYLVAVDNTELSDIDIFDITDPTQPQQIADIDPIALFPGLVGSAANGNSVFHVDSVVKRIGGQMRMLVSYRDAGYFQLDVTNPASPTLITDTQFAAVDPLTGFEPPEGNANQAEFSHDGRFVLAADQDVVAFRPFGRITQAPHQGVDFASAISAAEPIAAGTSIAGDTVFVGAACTGTVAAPPPGVTIAVAERGVCAGGFQEKSDAIQAAGYSMAVIFNNSFGAGGGRCESLINMLIDPAATIPSVFVGRADGLRILGVFNSGTYQCTGAAALTGGDTVAPAVGTPGLTIDIGFEFDGWGYAHLYDAQTSAEVDTFAIPEGLSPKFAQNFGDLSINEFAADPAADLAFASYYSGGVRAFTFGAGTGLVQTGAWIDDEGSNITGIERFTPATGGRFVAVSDRDFGLQILRYTGPPALPAAAAPPAATDIDPPQTTITKKPKRKTKARKAKFRFSSDEPNSTFECKLGRKAFKTCTSTFKKRVTVGRHKFEVRAIDAAGNVDETPAVYKWKVKKRAKR